MVPPVKGLLYTSIYYDCTIYIYILYIYKLPIDLTHLQDQGRRLPLRAAPLEVILEAMVDPMKQTVDLEAVLVGG